MKNESNWARLLAYVTGLVNQELLLQNEYLAAENRILRSHLPSRLRLSNPERETLAEIGKRLGRKALAQVACVARPDTILAWYRRLIAAKFDGSKHRSYPGRPRISPEVEALVVSSHARTPAGDMTGSPAHWLISATRSLTRRSATYCGGTASLLLRSGARQRAGRISSRPILAVLAGIDFFTVEVLTWRGLATYYVLFVIQLETTRVTVAGITRHPTEEWMQQIARNLTDIDSGALRDQKYLLHDRRYEILCRIPVYPAGRRRGTAEAATAFSEPERVCGTLGAVGKRGVPVQTDPVRRSIASPSPERVRCAFPQRAQSSGQGKHSALSAAG